MSAVSLLFVPFVAALALSGCGEGASEAVAPTTAAPTPVKTARPEVREVVDSVSLAADLMPRRRAVLAAEVGGTVERLPVEEGQALAVGELIAAIDTRALDQAVAEAMAVHRQTEAQLGRARNLFERRSVTQKDLLDAITNHDVAEARLASAKLDLQKSRVRAPWAGKVSRKHAEVGDYLNPGQAVLELVDVSWIKVRAPAPAADVRFLEIGAPVRIRVEALGDAVFEGTVVRLGAELDPGARTLDVEAEIPNLDGRLRPGFFARMEITRRTLPKALLVPLSAVVDLGDRQAVFVLEEGRARRREVELGPTVGREVVVVAGIGAADVVIVEGGLQIGEGQLVGPVGTAAPETPAAPEGVEG